MTHFDLAVIGAGSGNMIVNRRFSDWKVAIIEQGRFGGTCLNVGCIPTKMFVHPADLARQAGHGPELGVRTRFDGADWPAIRDRIFGRIDPLGPAAREHRISLPNVTVYDEHCHFTGQRRLLTSSGVEITADQVVVAAGSRAVVPDLPGLDTVPHHTSDTIMRLEALPRRMVIVGGGLVAAEFAHVFSSYGTEVTQVHRGDALLGREDEDVSTRFTALAAVQWNLQLSSGVAAVSMNGADICVQLDGGAVIDTDVLLIATGRTSNGDRLGLDAAGVETDDTQVITVDEFQRTSADGVWALGDIANHFQLKHVANHEARVVRHNLLRPDDLLAADHRFVPHAVFTFPQIASVGLTEQAARADGTSYVAVTHAYAEVAYGWAMEDSGHFVKLLADPTTQRLLGAHLIGPQASVLVQPLIQAMSLGQRVPEIVRSQYWIHPALTEVVENALLKFGMR